MQTVGQQISQERRLRQLSLEELALTTRIPLQTLRCMEEDRFDALPGDVFARGFLRSYADAIGIDANEVVERFDSHRDRKDPVSLQNLPAVKAPRRQTRFGLAIAMAMLFILFTLAIAVVLRPRQSAAPAELSQALPEAVPGPHAVRVLT